MKIKKYAAIGWLSVVCSLAMAGPTRVTDLTGVSTNGGIILSWTEATPSGSSTLTSLDVRYDTSPITTLNWSSKANVPWLTTPGTPGTTHTAIVTGLSANTNYYFAMKTQDSSGSWSSMSTVPLTVTGGSTYWATLAWDPSPAVQVASYNLYYGTASGVYTTVVSAGNNTICTVSNLQFGVTYYFAATALDSSANESPFCNEVSFHKP